MAPDHLLSHPARLSRRAQLAAGQPISQLMSQALSAPDLISLAAGFVDPVTLPVEETGACLAQLFSDPAAASRALQYGSTIGYPRLREQLLARMFVADGWTAAEAKISVDQVVVTAGSNQFLHLVAETILDPGDLVLCAAPSYFVFLGTLANLGARSLGIAADEEGLIPEAVDECLRRLEEKGELPRVKAIYCTSYFDNPCSVNLSESRRASLVALAQRWSRHGTIYVIEDGAYRELRYHGDDAPSLRRYDESGSTVISSGTFSKCFSPGVRVGWGILPRELVGPVCDQKGNADFGSPNLAQHLMYEVLDRDLLDPHIRQIRLSYREKLDVMLAAADTYFNQLPGVRWIRPQGGLYVWMTLPEGIDTGPRGKLFERAMRVGVMYVPGQYCFPKEGPCLHNTLRLSFGVQSEDNIRRGMELLATAIRETLADQS